MNLSFISHFQVKEKILCTAIIVLLLAACASGGVYHRVKPGQTLYRISHAYDIDEIYLARVNGISDPTQLQVGTSIYIPGATSVRTISAAPKPQQQKKSTVSKPKTKPKTVTKSVTKSKPAAQTTKKRPQASTSPSNVKLLWPLKGKILRSFGDAKKGGGKGLEISAAEKSTVKAAAAGKVIYSGDGVKGYGHLIIVQHEADIYTVYGFNSRNMVRMGDFVSQGEKIALSGTPPGGGKPRLHFEVRKKKVAVNPIFFLP